MRYLFIILALCALLLVSCSNGNEAIDTATDISGEITTNDLDSLEDGLGKYDFGGDTITFYSRTTAAHNGAINATEETADVLNDAIYLRNRRLEDRFNFLFKEFLNENTTDPARNAVLAGDDSYDVINTRHVFAFNYAQEGLLYGIKDLPAIDISKKYWDQDLTSEITVGNKMYFAIGAHNISANDFTHVLLFNKKIAEDNKLDNLYEKVLGGQWTFDEYVKYTTATTRDLNGDSVMDSEDMFGYVSSPKQIPPNFWISSGLKTVSKDSDDLPVFTMPGDEKFFIVFNKIFDITWDNNTWMQTQSSSNVPQESIAQFQNNKALFMDCTAFYIQSLRAMDADFGIIPYPKWDEAQENYYSRIENCELFCVPMTNKKLEMTSVIIEALASESTRGVVDAYYDISLRTKFTRDIESMDMLDIIFANRVLDWGDNIWAPDIRDGILRTLYSSNNRDLASKTAALEATVNALIETTIAAFAELK